MEVTYVPAVVDTAAVLAGRIVVVVAVEADHIHMASAPAAAVVAVEGDRVIRVLRINNVSVSR